MNEENYPGAITLLQECLAAADTYRHFKCVALLTHKLQETLVLAEEQLDQALARTCYEFESGAYSKLQAAYRLLGKTQIAADQLLMHYTSAVHNTAAEVVGAFTGSGPASRALPFSEACSAVPRAEFTVCLSALCHALFAIVLSYQRLARWHSQPQDAQPDDFVADHVRRKLEGGLSRVWNDVQTRVCGLLATGELGCYRFEQFVQVLAVVHRLMEVGEEFCGSKSEQLQKSIRDQSHSYLRSCHAARIDELRIFLENESWEVCPVKANFDILQLQEFKPLRSALRAARRHAERPQSVTAQPTSPDNGDSSNHSQDGSSVSGNYFLRYGSGGSPFDEHNLEDTLVEEDFLAEPGDQATVPYLSDESEDEEEEVEGEQEEDSEQRTRHNPAAPVLTNTAVTMLRQSGQFMQMARLLRPVAGEVAHCLRQLLDCYLVAVHGLFARDLPVSGGTLYSLRLSTTLRRAEEMPQAGGGSELVPTPPPELARSLADPETLHGLAHRIVAVESLVFLAAQFEFLQAYLDLLVPPQSKKLLTQFHNQVTNVYNLSISRTQFS